MNAFIVELDNRPGELARIADVIAQKGINITGGGGAAWGDTSAFGFMTNDEAGTRSALKDAQCKYREVELIPVALEDKPGTLAQATRRLADAGINIEYFVPTGMSGGKMMVGIGVDKPEEARRALGEMAMAHA